MTKALLEVKNLSKAFPVKKDIWGRTTLTLKAVNNISLELHPGECLTIVGESGCGKSTMARLILKLIEADQGEVIFEGEDILKLKPAELRAKRQDMQMVFQNPFSSLDPRYKIADTIAEPLKIHRKMSDVEIKQRVLELIDLVELDETILTKYPHQCSGGQNQRVSIARALALNPKFIIADEAVSALDVSIQWKVLELFKKLQKELGISFLFIAHNLGVVKYIADRVAVMYLGEIVELASKEDLFNKPLHPYTKALLNAAPIADPKQRDRERILLEGDIPKPTDIPSGCAFHTRCPVAEARCSEIKPALESHGQGHQVSCLLV
ncbi:MAG: ATP-binding cassette domain-containing protein [Cyanobacteria bacterium]|nr:ATP-binding cassette domain-containing protein [Cyanobacteriota bacterium]MDA1021018.1 ATP-binding cassette domain-containing protein [Cyanobacteriota bacterium]